ncbi:hypothetical protein MPTK1_8g15220 [Marchantia polymorpha subsp. ruderalis]|uniref:Uncharacterized protein n=1 Tax=Marchantia polymorpha TaxID=3197 RepID=A0A2R6W1F6_MARPO|nr:hypothetical protein MARPO_0187s0009 [Marchantia polymorpha]BBN19957.1 hypothetical protein Mp_8g15220 [Marchantia polymorpha subsp. ruderalis]|eukprot:PTQ27686.1 hypothetical protein MARPO_0187s0009 [Marchantia polymorpha]
MMQYRARTGWKLSEIRKPEGSEETAAELRGPLAIVLEIHRSHRTGRNVEQCGGTRGDDDNEERALTDRTTRRKNLFPNERHEREELIWKSLDVRVGDLRKTQLEKDIWSFCGSRFRHIFVFLKQLRPPAC